MSMFSCLFVDFLYTVSIMYKLMHEEKNICIDVNNKRKIRGEFDSIKISTVCTGRFKLGNVILLEGRQCLFGMCK